MKSTGIVRKVDELGRIVLPMELRRTLGVDTKDALEIYTEGDSIILKKYAPCCISFIYLVYNIYDRKQSLFFFLNINLQNSKESYFALEV